MRPSYRRLSGLVDARRFFTMKGEGSRRVSGHARLDDLVRVRHGLTALDLVDVLHPLGDLAPNRVLLVEEAGVVEADKELAVGGIRARRAGHRSGAAHMRLLVELGLELLAASAGAGALRAAGLRHEPLDHAMEDDAVIKSITYQLLDPRHMVRREIRSHLDGDRSLGGFEDQSIFGDSHVRFSPSGFTLWNWTANGRPAIAPAMLSVNGIGVQRCNVSMTATRYAKRSRSVAWGVS